jgi:hypothetical protein
LTGLIDFIREKPAVALTAVVSATIIIGQLGSWLLAGMLANDFGVYWRAANGPMSSIYSSEFRFTPLAHLPFWPAFIIWSSLSVISIIWACRPHLNREELLFLLTCPPMTICLFTGQVSIVLAALLLWSFRTPNRIAAGIGIGVIATVKPQLVLLVPLLLLLRSDWKALSSSAVTFVVFVLLSIALLGLDLWIEWKASMENFRAFLHREGVINGTITPAAIADKWGMPTLPFWIGGIALGAWLVFRCRRADPVAATAVTTIASLWAAPYGMNYDLAAAAPFLILTIFQGRITSVIAISSAMPALALPMSSFEIVRTVKQSAAAT